jgi:hypothetical protein
LVVRIDNTPPTTPLVAPDLTAETDTGVRNNDDLTFIKAPDFSIGNLPAGAVSVELFIDGVLSPSKFESGRVAPITPLADGSYQISYRLVDAAGNRSDTSPNLSLTVDTFAAAPLNSLDLVASSDTAGTSQTDNVTAINRPVFELPNGSLPSDVQSVELLLDGLPVPAVYNPSTRQITPSQAIPDGAYKMGYRYRDNAGTVSESSPVIDVVIDTIAPRNLTINEVNPVSLQGTAEPGVTLVLDLGNGVPLNLTVGNDGVWRYALTPADLALLRPVNSNSNTITQVEVKATDAAGNTSRVSTTVSNADFQAPIITEFVPKDDGFISAGPDAKTQLNFVFSEPVVHGSGSIKIYRIESNTETLIETINVSPLNESVQITGALRNDVYVELGQAL